MTINMRVNRLLALLIIIVAISCITACKKAIADIRLGLVGRFALTRTDSYYGPSGQGSTTRPDTLSVIVSMIDPYALVFNNDSLELAQSNNTQAVVNGPLTDSVPCIDELIF